MIQHNGKTLLTTEAACGVLNRSMEALRQMLYRKRLGKHKIGNRIYLFSDEISNFLPKKKGYPKFDPLDHPEDEIFYSFTHVLGLLNYTAPYLKTLIKIGKLVGYCTADGQILIPKSSLDNYMGVFNEAEDL